MVCGVVIEVAGAQGGLTTLCIDCEDRSGGKGDRKSCSVQVDRNELSERIEIGDSLRWEGDRAYWTPKANSGNKNAGRGVDFDIAIPLIGCGEVKHPAGCET